MGIGFLGIDIAKAKFDVALLINDKFKCGEFKNELDGFLTLNEWLKKYELSGLRACMEATGAYSEALATYLHSQEIPVSVVNPAQIKRFAGCKLVRTKTDKADAQLIAEFCMTMKPRTWEPKSSCIRELQQWVRRLEDLQSMRQQDYNRQGTAFLSSIQESIKMSLDFFDQQIEYTKSKIREIILSDEELSEKQKLLETIPGVGDATISQVLGFFGSPEDFQSAKQVGAFLGLNPQQHQSGTSVNKSTRISKVGDSTLRKSLYMPALAAIKYNPVIRDFYNSLVSRGKPKKSAVVACMRKLVHIIYGVLKNEAPFDPIWELKRTVSVAF
jgi:transposase